MVCVVGFLPIMSAGVGFPGRFDCSVAILLVVLFPLSQKKGCEQEQKEIEREIEIERLKEKEKERRTRAVSQAITDKTTVEPILYRFSSTGKQLQLLKVLVIGFFLLAMKHSTLIGC